MVSIYSNQSKTKLTSNFNQCSKIIWFYSLIIFNDSDSIECSKWTSNLEIRKNAWNSNDKEKFFIVCIERKVFHHAFYDV